MRRPGGPAPQITAVIFDMDGVVSDTEHVHGRIEAVMLAARGVRLTPPAIAERYAGLRDHDFFTAVFRDAGVHGDVPDAVAEKRRRLADVDDADIRAVPGARPLIDALGRDGFVLGLASSSPRAFIERVLAALGLQHAFAAVVSGDDVSRGKPDPAIFLFAAARLGRPPEACAVIEDGLAGMRAARAAGMACVALVPDGRRGRFPADLVVRALSDVTAERLRRLCPRKRAPRPS